MKRERDATIAQVAREAALASAPPANGENPTHREDFTRLVGAAARKLEREG